MPQVSRRRLMLPLALVAVAAVASSCSTFSDSDAVARVGDVSLSQDEFEDTLTGFEVNQSDPLDAELVRSQVLTPWIQEQLAAQPIDEDAVRASYDAGFESSGALCLSVIVVADESTAEAVAADLDGGRPFEDAFAESNVDQSLEATGGHQACVPRATVEGAAEEPFVVASVLLDADDSVGTAPLLQDGAEVAWVVVVFRPFDDLEADDIAVVAAGQGTSADVYVDPRYGTFDSTTSQVVGLG